MKRVLLIGKSGSGKTTLIQKLTQVKIKHKKTQTLEFSQYFIDTPGEYIENISFIHALMVTAADCDLIALIQDCSDKHTVFPPNFVKSFNKKSIGIITKLDKCINHLSQPEKYLEIAGIDKIFYVSSYTGEGIGYLKEYLNIKGLKYEENSNSRR